MQTHPFRQISKAVHVPASLYKSQPLWERVHVSNTITQLSIDGCKTPFNIILRIDHID